MLLISANPQLDEHDTGPAHPEAIARLDAAMRALEVADVIDGVELLPPRRATRPELVAVHDRGYLDALADLCLAGGGELDPDTPLSAGSWETAVLTAGAGLAAIEALKAGRGDAAFILGRPPGHHAERDRGMGFCLLNNVAVAAAALAGSGERVAIFDWDVHHGNGTQDIFYADPNVLYVSVHQWPLYPGTGTDRERGVGDGLGSTINLPLAPRATGDTYLGLIDEVVGPCVERFAPTWLLVSAGFDAHRNDPLGAMSLTAGDFADMTGRMLDFGLPAGRLALFLEGGYDPPAVGDCVASCASRLMGGDYRPEPASTGGTGQERIARYRDGFLKEEWR